MSAIEPLCHLIPLNPKKFTQKENILLEIEFFSRIRIKQTKRGDRIGIFTLDDGTGHIEVVCFSDTFNKYRALLNEDKIIIVGIR